VKFGKVVLDFYTSIQGGGGLMAFKDLVTPNISACSKIDNTLLIKALFISWKRSI
jgi:hypothetical protein